LILAFLTAYTFVQQVSRGRGDFEVSLHMPDVILFRQVKRLLQTVYDGFINLHLLLYAHIGFLDDSNRVTLDD
jgi:hypothetical protein